jgi:hypothetical protein
MPMANINDFPAEGRIIASAGQTLTFAPQGTKYELELQAPGGYSGPLNQRLGAMIQVKARKVFTAGAGGNFVAPIFGPPRVVQGRVLHVEEGRIVIRAGLNIIVEMPAAEHAVDLEHGEIQEGSIVNVVADGNATIQLLR